MEHENRFLTPSRKGLRIFGALFLVFFFFQIFHREIVVMQRELSYFETALYDEAKNQLKLEVEYFAEEFDYLITRVANNRYDTMLSHLDILEDNYFYMKTETNATSDVLERYLFRYADNIDAVYAYEIYDDTDLIQVVGDTVIRAPLINTDPYLGIETTSALLSSELESGYISNAFGDYLVALEVIDETYSVLLMFDLNALLSEERFNVLERFELYFDDRDDYIFVIEKDGLILLHDYKDHIGENIYAINDDNFEYAFETILESLEENTQAFSEYTFYTDESYDVVGKRVAYAVYYEPYDLIVAKSLPLTTFDPLINTFRGETVRRFLSVTLPLYGLLMISGGLTLYYVNRYAKQTKMVISEEEKLYQRISEMSTQAIIITAPGSEVLFANPIAEKIIGQRREDYQRPFHERFKEADDHYIFEGYKETYFVKKHEEDIRYHQKDARLYYLEDITDEVERRTHLQEEAYKDALTNLYNRRKLTESFSESLLPYVKENNVAAFGIIDFDKFKVINDKLGHDAGDTALQKVAAVFKRFTSDAVTFYRIGGDEFAVLAKMNRKALAAQLHEVKDAIEAMDFKGIQLTFTYGIASITPTDTQKRFSDYYSKADKALYYYKDLKA